MDLRTQYLGLQLKNPFVVGASSLAYDLDRLVELEAAGAAAIVMHSLFEEQIAPGRSVGYGGLSAWGEAQDPESKAFPLTPKSYLKHLEALKGRLSVPVIGSLNGIHPGAWASFAGQLVDHGADALELNLYDQPADRSESSAMVEDRALATVEAVMRYASVPVAVKLSPFYSSLPAFVDRLDRAGVAGVVLFNRFIQTDIDLETLSYRPSEVPDGPDDLLMRVRWVALLRQRSPLNLCLSGGVRGVPEALKALLAGAVALQVVSLVRKGGPSALKALVDGVAAWMREHSVERLGDLIGTLSFKAGAETAELVRSGYFRSLQAMAAEDSQKGE